MDFSIFIIFINFLILSFICYRFSLENDKLRSDLLELSKDKLLMSIKLDIYRNSHLYNVDKVERIGGVDNE